MVGNARNSDLSSYLVRTQLEFQLNINPLLNFLGYTEGLYTLLTRHKRHLQLIASMIVFYGFI